MVHEVQVHDMTCHYLQCSQEREKIVHVGDGD